MSLKRGSKPNFDDPREFFEWIKDLDADGLEKLGHLALALDHPH